MASSGKAAEPKTAADAAMHLTVAHKDERKKQRAQRIEQRFANEAKEKGLARVRSPCSASKGLLRC